MLERGDLSTSKKLSLIIPCYNEARNLQPLIERLRGVFVDRNDVEVVLVDNGSTDDTPQQLLTLLSTDSSIRTVRVEKNRGYGFGILQGLAAAKGEYLGWTHADMQTDPADALRALQLIEERGQPGMISEMVPELIYVKGKRYGRPPADVLFTIGMSLFESLYFRRKLWDINAQPNVFSRALYEKCFIDGQPPHDFSLDLYAYLMAIQLGVQPERIPVCFGKRLHGVSHWNVNWRAKWKFIRRTVQFSVELKKELKHSSYRS